MEGLDFNVILDQSIESTGLLASTVDAGLGVDNQEHSLHATYNSSAFDINRIHA